MHHALIDLWIDAKFYTQGFKPTFDSVHHPTPVSIYNPNLLHALICKAFPAFPFPSSEDLLRMPGTEISQKLSGAESLQGLQA